MSGLCKDCEWWALAEYDPEGMGSCRLAESMNGSPANRISLAYAMDAEVYEAWLYTKPDFGCVQFEGKL
jgi:hypothetical protein